MINYFINEDSFEDHKAFEDLDEFLYYHEIKDYFYKHYGHLEYSWEYNYIYRDDYFEPRCLEGFLTDLVIKTFTEGLDD